jgi:transposase-like protein
MMKPDRPFKSKGAPYPQEFREEAVRRPTGTRLASGQSLKTVATDLGITTECLRAWRRQMESPEDQAPANRDSTSAQDSSPSATAKELALARELGELRRELEAMTRQRDILKKLFPSSPKTRV